MYKRRNPTRRGQEESREEILPASREGAAKSPGIVLVVFAVVSLALLVLLYVSS